MTAKKPATKRPARKRKPSGPPPELLDPWDRQPGESDQAWQAWTAYRDQELPRSLRRAARTHGNHLTTMAKHSERWQWVTRAAAWDVEKDRARTREMLAEQEALGRRHATIAQGHLQALNATMGEVLRRLNLPEGDPVRTAMLQAMDPVDLLRLQTQAARAMPRVAQAERLARGLNTEGPPAADPAADARRESDEELRRRLAGLESTDAPAVFLAGADAGAARERARQMAEQRDRETTTS
jgi:hypothetical protein